MFNLVHLLGEKELKCHEKAKTKDNMRGDDKHTIFQYGSQWET
jgi:hypothetical protein